MNSKTLRHAIATGTFLVLIGSLPALGHRMIQNTTVGTVSTGYAVPCWECAGWLPRAAPSRCRARRCRTCRRRRSLRRCRS
jgi:hypothetical protein